MTQNETMPDFVDALEQRLRHAARTEAPRHRAAGATVRRRVALAGVACAALVVLLFAATASDDHATPRAYGAPLILQTPPVKADEVLEQIQSGMSVKLVLGPQARLTSARPIEALGGTAFILTGDSGWCLTAPDRTIGDPSKANPARRGAVTCARTADVYRYGIALGIGGGVIAVVPAGAKPPAIVLPDGTGRDLAPSDEGVVVADDLPDGAVFNLYGADGTTRSLRLR